MIKRFLNWRSYAIVFGALIVLVSFFYINSITKEMEKSELEKVQTTIEGIRQLSNADLSTDVNFATSIVSKNKTIPMITVNEQGEIIDYINLDPKRIAKDTAYLQHRLKEFKAYNRVIITDFKYGKNYVYYGYSPMLEKLTYYPLIQLAIILVFVIIVLIAVFNAQKSLQNQVWVGMSKETAHQMGTPLSSIVGWMEILKENDANKEYVAEMENDVKRLKLVADRFSKIGSIPTLEPENIIPRIQAVTQYMKVRAPKKVSVEFETKGEEDASYLVSGPLLDWVIENLIRNALDAIEGNGTIKVTVKNTTRQILIDVEDSGKGISKKEFKNVFKPGYSTKKRGWGLGLSLAKRIIEDYHHGLIFVKNSEIDKGTIFRIVLTR
ncbi:MAG TPA: HAMP domain-containing sensor histidine kinase [Edaphocola sp.]|nr:HAMP domain-containing sensor histidine kinase [Edaphocola sp.]